MNVKLCQIMCCIAKISIDVAPTFDLFVYNDKTLTLRDKENQTTCVKKSDRTQNNLRSLLIQHFTKHSLYTVL